MELKNLLIEKNAGICTVKINNPQTLNSLNAEVLKELECAFDQIKDDDEIQVVVLTGEGKAFVAGADIAYMRDLDPAQAVASVKAKFGQPEVGLGIIPGFSGTQRLARLVGLGRAKELIFTGGHIDAEEAYRIGLVNKVTEKEGLMEETYKMADKIKSNSGVALKYAKESMNRGTETDIDTGIAYESNVFGLCFASEDQEEGMSAFLEKRHPNFK